jgi:hypothetical protein
MGPHTPLPTTHPTQPPSHLQLREVGLEAEQHQGGVHLREEEGPLSLLQQGRQMLPEQKEHLFYVSKQAA